MDWFISLVGIKKTRPLSLVLSASGTRFPKSHFTEADLWCSCGHIGTNTNPFNDLLFSPLTPPSPPSWGRGEGRGGTRGCQKKTALVLNRITGKFWCLGPESNRHGTKYRGILSPLRLPFPPPRRWRDFPRIQRRSQEGKEIQRLQEESQAGACSYGDGEESQARACS